MEDNKWHSGPPPSLGWWHASTNKNKDSFRWWNGKFWSFPASQYDDIIMVGIYAKEPSSFVSSTIQWKHRPSNWPARSLT